MDRICVVDSLTGRETPASWYINPQFLQILDTTQTNALLHELTQMEAQAAEYELQGVSFTELSQVHPITRGFDYVGYKQKLKEGRAEFISRSATNFPSTDRGMQPHVTPVIPIGTSYTVNFFENESSQRLGMNIDSDAVMDCRDYIGRKLDEAWHKGGQNPDGLVIKGMFDYLNGGGQSQIQAGTSIYKQPLSTGAGGDTWEDKTGKEIYDEMAKGVRSVYTNSKKNSMCNKIAMGLVAHESYSTKLINGENGGNIPLKTAFERAFPNITIVIDPEFDAIDFDGTSHETWDGTAGSGAVLFYDDRPKNFKFYGNPYEIVRPYEYSGFVTKVNVYGLTTGIQMKRNYCGTYIKGVS